MQDIYPPSVQNNSNSNDDISTSNSVTSSSISSPNNASNDNSSVSNSSSNSNTASGNISSMSQSSNNPKMFSSIGDKSTTQNVSLPSFPLNNAGLNGSGSRQYSPLTSSSSNTPRPISSPTSYGPSTKFGSTINDDPFAQWDNDTDDSFGGGWGAPPSFSRGGKSNVRLSPEERVQMIERLFQEILGRKAETKDINYYKFSTLSEDEIRKQLITGKEHKELLANGNEFKPLKERCDDAENRVRMLEAQIKDQIIEFQKLAELLKSKNRYIQELRQQANNPYNIPENTVRTAQYYNRQNQQAYYGTNSKDDNSDDVSKNKTDAKDKKSYSILDRIGSILGD